MSERVVNFDLLSQVDAELTVEELQALVFFGLFSHDAEELRSRILHWTAPDTLVERDRMNLEVGVKGWRFLVCLAFGEPHGEVVRWCE